MYCSRYIDDTLLYNMSYCKHTKGHKKNTMNLLPFLESNHETHHEYLHERSAYKEPECQGDDSREGDQTAIAAASSAS